MKTEEQEKYRPVRLKDIAEMAGVSRVAVQQVLLNTGGERTRVGDETRQRILSIAADMDYRPNRSARTLVGGRSGMIGVLIDSQAPWLHFDYLGRIEAQAMDKGYRTMIASEHDNMSGIANHVMDFLSYGIEGVISIAHDYPEFKRQAVEVMRKVPHIVFIGNPEVAEAAFVEVNIDSGIRRLVEYLAACGRKRIALLIASLEFGNVLARHRGYKEGLEEAALPYDPTLVWENRKGFNLSEWDVDSFIEQMVVANRADAVIALNDMIAAAVISGLHDRNIRVPDDVAVTGVDDMEFSRFFIPSITTIRQPPEQVATKTFDLLEAMLSEQKEIEKNIRIEPEIIFRDSA